MKTRLLLMLFVFAAFAGCKKDDSDYRDKFVGAYQCQVTGRIDINNYTYIYNILIDSSKITYCKDDYIKDSASLLPLYKEEYKTITDTLYVRANGKSYIKIASLNPKIIGERDDDFGQYYASVLSPEYYFDISVSDNGEFEGDFEYQLRKDSIKGLVFNDSIKFCYKSIYHRHIYDDIYRPVSIMEFNYKGKKIK